MQNRRVALIPAYQPNSDMAQLVQEIKDTGFQIVVVDDGSSPDKEEVFRMAAKNAVILKHNENRGKGRALKTGLDYIYSKFSADCVVVTVDADGQHKPNDVERVCKEAENQAGCLILGSRKMKGDIPLRSRFGNTVTRLVYQLFTKIRVYDTQTGLRAFEGALIPKFLGIVGERYEYEMNVLLECSGCHIPIKEVSIETVYLDNNSSSHFDTLKDSYRIYKEILKFSAASFGSFLIDYGMYSLLTAITATGFANGGAVAFSNIGARIVSAVFNYMVNRNMVFQSKENPVKSALKYFTLAVGILVGNTIMLEILVNAIGMNHYVGKLCTEFIFFFASWFVQSHFIFQKKEE